MLGNNIKEMRSAKGLTQKDLAGQLFVTPQAVSRWENDESEPSTSTLVKMAEIFGVTVDEILGVPLKSADSEQPAPAFAGAGVSAGGEAGPAFSHAETKPQPESEAQPQSAPRPVLALCDKCNKPIFESANIMRWEEIKTVHYGRSTSRTAVPHIYCKSCNEKRLLAEKERAAAERRQIIARARKFRIASFILGGLALVIGLIVNFTVPNASPFGIVLGILAFLYIGCLMMKNNFLGDLTETIMEWGFVRMPGVIFSFSFEGFLFLIAIKILFFLLGIALSIFVSLFAIAVGMALSVFVYPYALYQSIHHPEEFDD